MRQVKKRVLTNLLQAMHECNMSDVDEEHDNYNLANDLPSTAVNQQDAYGTIQKAIRQLGAGGAANVYTNSGDIEMAVEYLEELEDRIGTNIDTEA